MSVQVEEWVLLDLFDAFNIEEGVERGCYDLRLERLRLDPAKRCEGVSFYIRLYDAASPSRAARSGERMTERLQEADAGRTTRLHRLRTLGSIGGAM